jgi:ABC-2 type transport system ATP-binding protein
MSSRNGRKQEVFIDMKNASLVFGNGTGVSDLTFTVKSGTILGLIGPSGCGKTTTIRLLTGIYQPTAGEVKVFDKNPRLFSDVDKSRIGYIPQHFIMYQNLSVEENLNFMGGMYGITPADHREKMNQLLEFFELEKARRRLGRHLSGGMQRRLMLAGALLHDPELVFADEPTAGIDPILRERIWEYFRNQRNEGASLLITTQYVGEAAYCDLVAVMRKGLLVDIDTPAALRRKAMGGDIIHLHVGARSVFQVMELLAGLRMVKKVEQVEGKKGELFVYLSNAGKGIPILISALKDNLDITPKKVEPYYPPFDEVFVRLLKHSEVV